MGYHIINPETVKRQSVIDILILNIANKL